jgi:uncharacterized protein DUF4126
VPNHSLANHIAPAAHGGKTAARAAVTPSPEPFSNIALGVGQDVIAVGLTWFAGTHPFLAAAIDLSGWHVFVVRLVLRPLLRLFRGAEGALAGSAKFQFEVRFQPRAASVCQPQDPPVLASLKTQNEPQTAARFAFP